MSIDSHVSKIVDMVPAETFMLAYRGSIAHGMYVPKDDPNHIDDIDLMGFVFGSIENYFGLREWGSRGTKEIRQDPYDIVLYEIKKAFSLLLQGNPNILGMLWTEPQFYVKRGFSYEELIASKELFVGKHVYNAFAGYAHSQLTRMESRDPAELREYLGVTAELKCRGLHPNHKGEQFEVPTDHPRHFSEWSTEKLITRLRSYQKKGENLGYMGDKRKHLVLEHGYDSKNAAHLIRLLRMCIEFMDTGMLQVTRTSDREELLAIKSGKWPLVDVKALAEQLFVESKNARDRSTLPDSPQYEKAEELLVNMIREQFSFNEI